MKETLNRVTGVIFQPRKTFGHMQPASGYSNSDILLILILSPLIFTAVWGLSIIAGLHHYPLADHALVILGVGIVTIVMWLLLGRVWSWYVAWAVRRFAASEIGWQSAYQIFACTSAPVLFLLLPLLVISLVNVFPFLATVAISIYVPLTFFSFLVPLWVLVLQWVALMEFSGVSWGKALSIVLAPVVLLKMFSPLSFFL